MKALEHWMSDEAYLQRQRRFLAIKRPLGVLLLVMSCVVGAIGIWVWFNHNPRDLMAGDPNAQVAYDIGLIAGFTFTKGIICIVGGFLLGVSNLWGWRGTRMLIEFHDQLQDVKNENAS